MRYRFTIHIFLVCLVVHIPFLLQANTYDVNSLGDTNTGSGNSGTLRYCITQANSSAGPHLITFSVAGTIFISTSSLPALQKETTIDGSTAPGYNGIPVVVLNGSNLGGGNGIEIKTAHCSVYALEITSFPYNGLVVTGNNSDYFRIGAAGKGNLIRSNQYRGISIDQADYGSISYNHIGTDATGDNCFGNEYDGIDLLNGADYDTISNNHVSCNFYNGIQLGGSSHNVITGNIIGPLAVTCTGNEYRGIDIEDGSNYNIVGGINPADFNKIAGNLYWGVEVKNSSAYNQLLGNSYSCNEYGAIALSYSGNNSIAPPLILSAGITQVSGQSLPNAVIELFKSQNTNPILCLGTPVNQGTDFLLSTTADGSGNWTAYGTFGGYVVATQRDGAGNTSAFSASVYCGQADTLINDCSGYIINSGSGASFSISDTSICEKYCIDFFDQSPGAVSWSWIFDGASPSSSGAQNPTGICYNNPGVYNATLTVTDANGGTATVTQAITVNSTPPIPIITFSGDTLVSTPAAGYQWFLDNNEIPGATGSWYLPQQEGYYYVLISDSTGCTSISAAVYVTFTGIANGTSSNSLHIYVPLGSRNLAVQNPSGMILLAELQVTDLYGRLELAKAVWISQSTNSIPLNETGTGWYLIRLASGSSQQVIKAWLP